MRPAAYLGGAKPQVKPGGRMKADRRERPRPRGKRAEVPATGPRNSRSAATFYGHGRSEPQRGTGHGGATTVSDPSPAIEG